MCLCDGGEVTTYGCGNRLWTRASRHCPVYQAALAYEGDVTACTNVKGHRDAATTAREAAAASYHHEEATSQHEATMQYYANRVSYYQDIEEAQGPAVLAAEHQLRQRARFAAFKNTQSSCPHVTISHDALGSAVSLVRHALASTYVGSPISCLRRSCPHSALCRG